MSAEGGLGLFFLAFPRCLGREGVSSVPKDRNKIRSIRGFRPSSAWTLSRFADLVFVGCANSGLKAHSDVDEEEVVVEKLLCRTERWRVVGATE